MTTITCVHCELAEERAENERLRAAAQAVVDNEYNDTVAFREAVYALRDVLKENGDG